MIRSYICEYCKEVEFNCNYKLAGHKRWCRKRKEIIATQAFDITIANNYVNEEYIKANYENIEDTESNNENIDDTESYNENLEDTSALLQNTEITDSSFIEAYEKATNAYIMRQKVFLNVDELVNLEAGFTKNIEGLRNKADIRIYIEICECVSNCHGLSISECDELLELIRRVSYINGLEIPIPAKYYTIHDKIFKALSNKSIRIIKTHYDHCQALFGNKNKLGKIPAVVTDILDMISYMLVDPEIYPFLHLEYEEAIFYQTEITYGNNHIFNCL